MYRYSVLGVLATAAIAFTGLASADHKENKKAAGGRLATVGRDDDKTHAHGPFEKCANACAHCSVTCESCFKHCADLVAEGKKRHTRTMRLCLDCGELCATGARLSARHGVLAGTACEACARACDACAAGCEKTPSDEHMRACARACRDCAAACRDMIKHGKQQE